MAKAWKDVMQSPGYNSLNPEEQQKAQRDYFDDVVAPSVPQGKLGEAFDAFYKAYPRKGGMDITDKLYQHTRNLIPDIDYATGVEDATFP